MSQNLLPRQTGEHGAIENVTQLCTHTIRYLTETCITSVNVSLNRGTLTLND